MRGVGNLIGRRRAPGQRKRPATRVITEAKTGERPYADITDSQLAAYRLAAAPEGTGPRPEFHPAPATAPVTAPMPVLNAEVPPPPSLPAWAAATDREAMERMAGALQEFDFDAAAAAREQEGMTYAAVLAARTAEAPPAPGLSRAERFTADMRFRGGLPLFRKTAAAVGWRGLNEDPPVTGWPQYTVARWDQQARVAIAAATEAARAEVHAHCDAALRRVMAPGHAAAGAR